MSKHEFAILTIIHNWCGIKGKTKATINLLCAQSGLTQNEVSKALHALENTRYIDQYATKDDADAEFGIIMHPKAFEVLPLTYQGFFTLENDEKFSFPLTEFAFNGNGTISGTISFNGRVLPRVFMLIYNIATEAYFVKEKIYKTGIPEIISHEVRYIEIHP